MHSDDVNSKHPVVSIIMPAYNCENYISQAIESIIQQSYENWELLICDDCSSDNTLKILSSIIKDDRIKIFQNDVNKGYLQTCNFLFMNCKGNFITFQDADDWSHQLRIEKLLAEMLRRPNIGLCTSNYSIVINNVIGRSSSISTQINFLKKEIPFNFPCLGASVMITMKVLNEIGGYHPYFDRLGGEHLEWISRIVDRFDSIVIESSLYYYRYLPESFSNGNYGLSSILMSEILKYGILKRRTSGTNPFDEFLNKEIFWIINEIGLSNSKISELYRIRAAHDIDKKKVKEAYECLRVSFRYKFFSVRNFRTLFYMIRVWVILNLPESLHARK